MHIVQFTEQLYNLTFRQNSYHSLNYEVIRILNIWIRSSEPYLLDHLTNAIVMKTGRATVSMNDFEKNKGYYSDIEN